MGIVKFTPFKKSLQVSKGSPGERGEDPG